MVNPRHRRYYCNVVGYTPLGGQRVYGAVRGHPAEAFFLDVPLMRVNAPEMHRKVFGEPLPDAVLLPACLPATLIRLFARNSSQTDPRIVEEILRLRCGLRQPAALVSHVFWHFGRMA